MAAGNGLLAGPRRSTIRCAIYTRKSTEEGLEQAFNTLDAQRDSAEAFIRSQRGEGWVPLPDHYDDGGFTGANMDRPALQKLLQDVRDGGLVGDHPKLRSVVDAAAALAPAAVPVLIQGETGTGKELIARLIHILSGRPADRFEPINCSAIPTELVESTLFGHKKGAFTTAIQDQPGKFELADGGTLVLDEVGELPPAVQAKLLRVLQDGEVEPLGARKRRKVDVRVIAATHRNLRRMVQQGTFREDLYYRLNVAEIKIPPLRERRSDIPKIALAVLDKINSSLRHPKRLSAEALIRLQQQRWPGNVRDLQNTIERSVWLCRKPVLGPEDLLIAEPESEGDLLSQLPEPGGGFSLEELLRTIRHQMILRALDAAAGNQSKAARMLGISPQAVHKFLRKPGKRTSTEV